MYIKGQYVSKIQKILYKQKNYIKNIILHFTLARLPKNILRGGSTKIWTRYGVQMLLKLFQSLNQHV